MAASPEEIFDAWTDPESLAVWMAPGSVQRAEVELEARVGGRLRIVMKSPDSDPGPRGPARRDGRRQTSFRLGGHPGEAGYGPDRTTRVRPRRDPGGEGMKDERGSYSTYARGIDLVNTTYNYLDLVPKGRDEGSRGQFWVRRHDEYGR
jgi:hypothetical protein